MERESLQSFVDAARSRGASDEFLAELLTRRGWSEEEVYGALGDYWARMTGVPLPGREPAGESSRDAFLYLLSFSTLATWATALGSLLFQFINHAMPDPVARGLISNFRLDITWQMASIAVAFPIYAFVARTIFRETADQPERLKSGVRRWLTWLALLITAGAMICDLIVFLDYFLTGEITARFVLKSVVVFCIAGAIFAYYLGALRWKGEGDLARERSRSIAFGGAAALVTSIAFVTGLLVAGTPSRQRSIEADNRRIADLRQISQSIASWHGQARDGSARPVPPSLNDPSIVRLAAGHLNDPESGAFYEYHPLDRDDYELCARFNRASEPGGTPLSSVFWNHAAGRACFTFNAFTPGP